MSYDQNVFSGYGFALDQVKTDKFTKEENNIFENISAIEDRILPDVLEEKADYLYLGYNKYSRTFVITIYPEQTWLRLVRGTCIFRRCNNFNKS